MNKLHHTVLIVLLLNFLPTLTLSGQTPGQEAYSQIEEAKTFFGAKAFPALERAQEICATGCSDSIMGSLYRRWGVAYFQENLSADQALDFTDQAIDYFTKAFGPNHPKVFSCQFNKGIIAKVRGRQNEAEASFLQAFKSASQSTLVSSADQDSIMATYLKFIGSFYVEIGDYTLARTYAEQALQIANLRWKEAHGLKSQLIRDLGRIHLLQQDYRAALPYYLQSLEIQKTSSSSWGHEVADRYSYIGLCYMRLGKLPEAEKYFESVLQHYDVIPTATFAKRKSFYQNYLAYAYADFLTLRIKQKRWPEAVAAYEKSLSYALEVHPKQEDPIFAYLFKDRAILAAAQGSKEEALAFCQKARKAILGDDTALNAETVFIGKPYHFLEIIALEADLLEKNGDIPQAIAQYQYYNQLIGLSRLRLREPLSKSFLIDLARPVYEKAIALCISEYDKTGSNDYLHQAFQFNAANKAILLFEELQGQKAMQFSGIPSELIKEEETLRYGIIATQKELAAVQEDLRDSLNLVFNEQQRTYDLFLRQMEQSYPGYFQLKHNIDQDIDPRTIQENLENGQALVEYFIGEKDLFIFLVSKDKIEIKRNPIMNNWQDSLLLLREFLSNSIEEDCAQQFTQLSHGFYQWLLAPVAATFAQEKINRLVIVPDGMLTLLPFEALLTTPSAAIKSANAYVLSQYALSYTHSSRALLESQEATESKASKFFAGFGLEYDETTLAMANAAGLGELAPAFAQPAIDCEPAFISSRDLGYLQYSDDEVREIASLLGGDQWLNELATKETFIEQAPNYQILHLAMHGSIDNEEPLNSSLIFTYGDSLDFLLSVADIYTLDLSGQLVVLSACNTAAGKWSSSTGPLSLARAFHYAGMPTVTASLWSISDYSTAGLMQLFYQYLDEGIPKDIALQKAKITYLEDDAISSPFRRDPAFWAGPVIIGDSSPITQTNAISWWWILLLLFLSGLVFWRFKGGR